MNNAVEAVLAGVASYDDLTEAEQAEVRVVWEARDAEAIARLDFTRVCPGCGVGYDQVAPGCRGHVPRG